MFSALVPVAHVRQDNIAVISLEDNFGVSGHFIALVTPIETTARKRLRNSNSRSDRHFSISCR
jgi:hypothetical protein